jgi:segregation and condensation protein A
MRIKAKMLLPRYEKDAQGNEIDPREELVQHLLEYKKYKSVISEMSALEESRANKEARGNVLKEIQAIAAKNQVDMDLQDVNLYKLLKVYQKVIDRHTAAANKPVHTVIQYPYTITQQKDFILHRLADGEKLSFTEVISADQVKMAVIYNFLAILELLQSNQVSLHIEPGYNNFWIEKTAEVMRNGE